MKNKKIISALFACTLLSSGLIATSVVTSNKTSRNASIAGKNVSFDKVDAKLIGADSGKFCFEEINTIAHTVRLINGAADNCPIHAKDWTIPSTFQFQGVTYTIEEIGYRTEDQKLPLWQRWCFNGKGHEGFNISGTLTLPSTLKSIGLCAFQWNNRLSAIDLSNCESLEYIGASSFFQGKTGIGRVPMGNLIIPKNVKNICANAFEGCMFSEKIQFKGIDTIPSFGYNTFSTDTISGKVYVPKNMAQVYKYQPNFPFVEIYEDDEPIIDSSIELSLIDGTSVKYKTNDVNALISDKSYFDINGTQIDRNSIVSVKINDMDKVTEIDNWFLINCLNLKTVDLSGLTNLRYVGDFFMSGNFSLEEVIFPNAKSFTTISNSFLRECHSLKNVDFTNLSSVKEIGDCFLAGDWALESLDLSPIANVDYIASYWFLSNCYNLTSINFGGFDPEHLHDYVKYTIIVDKKDSKAYTNGVKINGENAEQIKNKLLNSDTNPYRNLI